MASVSLLPSMYSTGTLAVSQITLVSIHYSHKSNGASTRCANASRFYAIRWCGILSQHWLVQFWCHGITAQSHGKVCFFFHGMPHYQRGWEEGKILHKHKHTNKLQKWLEYWTPQEIGWLWDSSPYLETGQRQQHPVNLTTPTWDDIPWGSPWQNPHELYIDSI